MSDFPTYVQDILSNFGSVQCRKMFGGHGVYYNGVMFGLIANETLYLKADRETAPLFEERGLPAFEYTRSGKVVKLSYYQAPEELFEQNEAAVLWARRSYDVALKVGTGRKKQRKESV